MLSSMMPRAVKVRSLSLKLSSVMMALMTFTGWLSDRKGERYAIVAGMGMFACSMVVFIFSRNFVAMSLAFIMFGMGQALMGPAYSSLISKAVPEVRLPADTAGKPENGCLGRGAIPQAHLKTAQNP